MKEKIKLIINNNKKLFTLNRMLGIIIGTAIISFAIYNIHEQANITEGGVLGMILLLVHWTGLTPSIISPLLDLLCYIVAYVYLGWDFIKISLVSSLCLAGFFRLWEQFLPILPEFVLNPWIAAIMGGILVGIGVGLVVRQGGSSGGDDALAIVISKLTKIRLSKAYMITDFIVLILSLTYIPLKSILYSLITVTISSYIIELMQYDKNNKSKNC